MKIDEDGEVYEITEEDIKYARKNPYAKMFQAGTVVLDMEVIDFFKKIGEKKDIYYGKLISDTLKEYIAKSEQNQQ